MPVEIRELVIRATVPARNASDAASDDVCAGSLIQRSSSNNSAAASLDVGECIGEVLKILARKKER